MKDYSLQSDEVLLYEGYACRMDENVGGIDLLLTNLFLVLISRKKKLFSKEEVHVETMPLNQVKIYEGVPQILQKGNDVNLYFADGEVSLRFIDKNEMRKFTSAALTLLTGKSTATRGAEKVNKAVGIVDNALGINSVDTVKGVLENGLVGSVLGGFRKKNSAANNATILAKDAIDAARDIFGKKESPKPAIESASGEQPPEIQGQPAFDSKVESLKKLKDLLDMGILTQEEFEAKRAEIVATL